MEPLRGFELLDVPEDEPAAVNALLLNEVVILPTSFPKTHDFQKALGEKLARRFAALTSVRRSQEMLRWATEKITKQPMYLHWRRR